MKNNRNRIGVLFAIIILTGFWLSESEDLPASRPIPKNNDQSQILDSFIKHQGDDTVYWENGEIDSLRRLYDKNHPDYIHDPNDPNKTDEWEGYYNE